MTTSHHSHPTEIGPVLAGRHVHDETGGDIGSVTDVLFDRRGRAEYLPQMEMHPMPIWDTTPGEPLGHLPAHLLNQLLDVG